MPRITQDVDPDKKHPLDKEPEVRTTPKGTDFVIKAEPNGLYFIKMIKAGGKVPAICEEKFTTLALAKTALEAYISDKE